MAAVAAAAARQGTDLDDLLRKGRDHLRVVLGGKGGGFGGWRRRHSPHLGLEKWLPIGVPGGCWRWSRGLFHVVLHAWRPASNARSS